MSEYYTAEQIAEKYKVNTKWVWTYTREHDILKVRIRQFNYYSKKHIDAVFAKYKTDDALTEWYTPEEIEEKYGMTRVAIRSHVYRNNIPSKKEHGQIFYSKLHFDLSKKTTEDDSSEYYTVQEAMKKYKGVYFGAIGGAGALLAKCIKKAELIAYEDLGAEALRKLYVEDMPLVVIIDSEGNNLYEEGRAEYLAEHKAHEAEKNA